APLAIALFAVCVRSVPHALLTRCIAGLALQSFAILYTLPLRDLSLAPLMHVAELLIMLAYCDHRALLPAVGACCGWNLFLMTRPLGGGSADVPHALIAFVVVVLTACLCGLWS